MRKVALYGNGAVSRKAATALIEDSFGTGINLVLPVPSADPMSDPVRYIAEWAMDLGVGVYAVTDNGTEWLPGVTSEVINSAIRVFESDHLGMGLLEHLSEGDTLVLAYDEDDPICERMVYAAHRKGMKALDLTTGLAELIYEDEHEHEPLDAPEKPSAPTPSEEYDEDDHRVPEWHDYEEIKARIQRISQVLDEALEEIAAIVREGMTTAAEQVEREVKAQNRRDKRSAERIK